MELTVLDRGQWCFYCPNTATGNFDYVSDKDGKETVKDSIA